MRLTRFKVAAITCVVITAAMASTARAGIAGSKHDFGTFAWSGNQICQPCHAPHNTLVKDANGILLQGPLWNHTLSTATYTMYQQNQVDANGNLVKDANGNVVSQPVTGNVDQNSKLCLSCHDGTVAVDSFGGVQGTQQMTGGVLGTDLSNDHPIGDNGIYPTNDGKTSTVTYMVDPSARDAKHIMPLRQMADGRWAVGCTSCHEPHNRTSQQHMLWVNNSGPATTVDGRSVSGSVLCLNCHKK